MGYLFLTKPIKNPTKNIILVVISSIIIFIASLFVLKLYSLFFPVKKVSIYCCEPRPRMWMTDSTIGYRNRPNLSLRAFSEIKGYTNNLGFRTDRIITPTSKEETVRVFGIGDSVMWGTRVNHEDSFLGLLEGMLKINKVKTEVINTGVVGYSTLQEYLFLEKFVVPLKPDIVLVNFCNNDFLPTEDPFNLRNEVYEKYLSSLLVTGECSFESFEKEIIENILESGISWSDFRDGYKNLHVKNVFFRVLLEIPILKMDYLAKKNGFRLIYLLIPSSVPENDNNINHMEHLKKFFEHNEIEYINLLGALQEDTNVYTERNSFGSNILRKVSKLFDLAYLSKIDPINSINRITLQEKGLTQLEKNLPLYHSKRNFIDAIGHPSKKGNNIIASEICKYLLKDSK